MIKFIALPAPLLKFPALLMAQTPIPSGGGTLTAN